MPRYSIEAPADKLVEYYKARDRKEAAAGKKMQLYYNDPVAFIHDCVEFPNDGGLTPYQEEVISMVPEKKRVAQRCGHGAGKSSSAAFLILWFALTRDSAQVDWKCPITAGAWRQLERYLMPEVRRWARQLRWDKIGREPFHRHEMLTLNLNLNYGSAFAVASTDPSTIEGAHADSMLYILDEAKIISDETFDAAEGAFSGAGVDGREAFALASSTPGPPMGRFYDIHNKKSGLEDWWTRHVTLYEVMHARRVGAEWARQRKALWGADSAVYANRVLGEFKQDDEDAMIPLAWIEAANERWLTTQDQAGFRLGPLERVGVDVARSGRDKTVIAPVHGVRVETLRVSFHEDTTTTRDRVLKVLDANPKAITTIDSDGLGAGVYDMVKEEIGGDNIKPFHASEATDWKDETGELGFLNVRAAAWYRVRQMLDPTRGAVLELPPDDQLLADLMTPKRKESARGKIQLESKDDIKKRLSGRSSDYADAVVLAMWENRKRRRRRMGNMGFGPKQTNEERLNRD